MPKTKDVETQLLAYFLKNKVVCLNSVFQKFGHSVGVIKALSALPHLEKCGEMTYNVYRMR